MMYLRYAVRGLWLEEWTPGQLKGEEESMVLTLMGFLPFGSMKQSNVTVIGFPKISCFNLHVMKRPL